MQCFTLMRMQLNKIAHSHLQLVCNHCFKSGIIWQSLLIYNATFHVLYYFIGSGNILMVVELKVVTASKWSRVRSSSMMYLHKGSGPDTLNKGQMAIQQPRTLLLTVFSITYIVWTPLTCLPVIKGAVIFLLYARHEHVHNTKGAQQHKWHLPVPCMHQSSFDWNAHSLHKKYETCKTFKGAYLQVAICK